MTSTNGKSWTQFGGVNFSVAADVGIFCDDPKLAGHVTPPWKQGVWTNRCPTNFNNCGVTLSASDKIVYNPTIVDLSGYTWVIDQSNPFKSQTFTFGVSSLSENPSITLYLEGLLGECFVSQVTQVSTLAAVNAFAGKLGQPPIPTSAITMNKATAEIGYSFQVTIEIWPANAPVQLIGQPVNPQSNTIENVSSFSLVCRITDNLTDPHIFSKSINVIHPKVMQLDIDGNSQ